MKHHLLIKDSPSGPIIGHAEDQPGANGTAFKRPTPADRLTRDVLDYIVYLSRGGQPIRPALKVPHEPGTILLPRSRAGELLPAEDPAPAEPRPPEPPAPPSTDSAAPASGSGESPPPAPAGP